MPPKYTAAEKKAYQEKKLKAAVKVAKAAKAIKAVKLSGRGDYRPSSMSRIKGRGDYFSDLLGGVGHGLGKIAGGAIGKIFGSGDYKRDGPRSNSIWRHREASSAQKDALSRAGAEPSMAPFTMGAMSVQFDEGPPRVTHREFIGPVLAPADNKFHTKPYRIQPGLKGTDVLFPWGSSVAACFQQYELMGMVLEYRTTSSNFSAESALGSVMLSTVYDANAAPLATQQAVDNNDFTTSTVPSASVYHPIECASKESPTVVRYVRTSNASVSIGSDERLDDVGVFQVSMSGITAAPGAQLGELWATYDIKFMKAELPDLHAGTAYAASNVLTDTVTFNADPFKDMVANDNSSLPCTLDTAGKIYLPVGYNGAFQLTYTSSASAAGDGSKDVITSGPGMVTMGTDVTPLGLLPFGDLTEQVSVANAYTPPLVAPTVGNPVSGVFVFLFSTIAENADQNWIQLSPQWTASTTTPYGLASALVITAMDSDLVTSQFGLERELLRLTNNPKIRKMLLQATQAEQKKSVRRDSLEYVYGTGEMTPIPSSSAAASAAAATEGRFASGMLSPFRRAASNK